MKKNGIQKYLKNIIRQKVINIKLEEISIEITHACPNLCKFCSSTSYLPFEELDRMNSEIKYSDILLLMKQARESGASILSLSGGEPSIHPYIREILKYAGDLGYEVFYYTSGTRYNGVEKEELITLGEDFICDIKRLTNNKLRMIFDIQGCDEKSVDYLMGIDGAFERLVRSIEDCRKNNIRIEGHLVPMNKNYRYIYETADFCEKIGLKKLSFLRAVPQGRMSDKNLMPSPQNFRDIIHILMNLYDDFERGRRKIEFRAGHPIKNFFALFDNKYEFSPCRGGSNAPLITPLGNCDMCPGWKNLKEYNAGNIIKDGFEKVWIDSNFFQTFRNFVKDGWKEMRGFCTECPFLSQCRGACTCQRIYYAGKGLSLKEALKVSPDPLCPYYNNFV